MTQNARTWYSELTRRVLAAAAEARVVVLGDFTVDAYFLADPDPEVELVSVETGEPVQIMSGSRFQPGGAGNVAANVASLGVGNVAAIGVVGNDYFAAILRAMLGERGIDASGVVTAPELATAVYAKVIDGGREQHRFDIGSVQRPDEATIAAIAAALRTHMDQADVVIVNQQLGDGYLASQPARERVLAVLQESAPRTPVLVDSRDFADQFPGCVRKLNQSEAYRRARSMVADTNPSWEWNPAHAGSLAQALAAYWTTPVIVTRGEHGAVVASPEGSGDQSHVVGIEGLRIDGPTDTVGAGDSFVAGVAVSVAAGISWPDAARFATVVAGVTVRKLFMTGTASPEEVRDAAANVELNYAPERLYPDAASAGTRGAPVEIITPVTRRQFRVAVFDHDGTISTLREGWEAVMRRHMLTAIVGEPARCEPARQREVMAEIDAYIERTTGVQTIIQMHGLVEMVQRYGYVGPEEIQSPAEYKAAYAAELRSGVHARLAALEAGTRTVEDFTVRGAVEFLSILRDRGLTLYLASGTDQDDTRAEAQALGYAGLFQEIRGSVDDTQKDPKRLVLEQILSNLSGPHAGAVVVFGDGPVEMREGRVHGAATVGVLSDEVRRYGWNHAKRCRQVSGGAQLLIPDFTDPDAILGHLFLEGS